MSLTLDELDSHLYGCADKIHDAVDPTDYKDFILPLVFYKVISDTYQDEVEKWTEELGSEELARDPDLHDIAMPEEYAWGKLRGLNTQETNYDEFINEALNAIEDANPDELDGVFRADYVGEDALDNSRLGRLVEHLSTYNLSAKRVPPDMLGEAYMDLVRHFAEQEGKEGGRFFTPPRIVRLMVRLLAPFEDGDRFHDPTVGSGGMLVEAAHYFRDEQNGDPSRLELTGQELNPDIAAIAKMNLFIHGYNGAIEREDCLRAPQFTRNGHLETFDYVLANFPFSQDWAKDELQSDPYDRFDWADKLPRADRGDYAFIMHMAHQLNDTGQAAIVIPHGVLFRKHEGRYREPMLEQDMVEAVVGLPENLFQNNSIPSAILVLNRDKPSEREGEVLFVHAADEAFYEELSNQNELTEEGLDHITRNFNEWTTEERVSRAVPLEEIRENDYNLNIALYVDTTEPEEPIDVAEELTKLRELQEERNEIESQLTDYMEALGYE
ncbi:type I restriction-modification system subunit M [Salinibacter ruber]|uniref:type I restriction-modification system subunit M n=1 Tax=Salinibacter ruber TaxID=146919 RepID=UPI002167F75A|nr:class I SAM-dependent DNA methyltransferase [Salinibacter ruber]MCS3612678.1 type I restriction enzyme M protein [Salinibacter ruber]